MPRPPKYPLQPLLEHRDRKVDDATAELGEAIETREAAAETRERAERARREANEAAAVERASEQAKMIQGELRAVDLARAEAWEMGVKASLDELGRAVDRAATELQAAHAAEGAARDELARKKADRDVVAKDETRFTDRARRAADAAEEDEAGEAWRDRRGSR